MSTDSFSTFDPNVFVDRWDKCVVSTEPLDRASARRALELVFIAADTDAPAHVVWVRSPNEAATVERQLAPAQAWPSGLTWHRPSWADWRDGPTSTAQLEGFSERLVNPGDDCIDWSVELSWQRVWQTVIESWSVAFDGASQPAILGPSFAGRASFGERTLRAGGGRSGLSGLAAFITEHLHMAWIFDEVVVLCERPVAIRRTPEGDLHHDRMLALEYADGTGLSAWRGDVVPHWVISNPTVARAISYDDPRIQRAALDRLGWLAVVRELGLPVVDECPDPGNPSCVLRLFALPESVAQRQFGAPVHVLVMTNGSPDRDGVTHTFAETVPGVFTTAMRAAAWQYGVATETYAQLARRT